MATTAAEWPRTVQYWSFAGTITPTRYPRLHLLRPGRGYVGILATDDLHDTAPTGPSFRTMREAFAWLDGPEAADWRSPLPPVQS